MTKTKTKPVRGKDGKFKKPDPVLEDPDEAEGKDEPQPLEQLVRVHGHGVKAAAIQTHNLKKNKDGEALPELSEGAIDE